MRSFKDGGHPAGPSLTILSALGQVTLFLFKIFRSGYVMEGKQKREALDHVTTPPTKPSLRFHFQPCVVLATALSLSFPICFKKKKKKSKGPGLASLWHLRLQRRQEGGERGRGCGAQHIMGLAASNDSVPEPVLV